MGKMADRKKLRREYLRRKTGGYGTMAVFIPIFLFALLVCILCAFGTIGFIPYTGHADYPALAGFIIFGALSGVFARCCYRIINSADHAIHAPYIPPVTPDTLPAEEVLVRGSEVSAVAQSEVLLRAAESREETVKEELLRVSQE